MKIGEYFFLLLMGVACAILTVALIAMACRNQLLQGKLQIQQQALNQGVLGQQGQQISAGVLQDLADAAVDNPGIRDLLEKHGYRVSSPRTRPAANSTDKKQQETPDAEASAP